MHREASSFRKRGGHGRASGPPDAVPERGAPRASRRTAWGRLLSAGAVRPPMTTVAIAGGGLAGLVAARHLAEAGADVTVFEKRDEVGGRVRTREQDGFVLDRGFQVLLTAYPAARRELDYGDLALRRFPPGAVIARDGQRSVLADPLRDPGALTDSLFSREVTTGDKLRTLRLRRELVRTDEEALLSGDDRTIREGLLDYGFSERFVERFAAPFYGGITLDRSLSSAFDVFRYTFKMFATGSAAVPATGMAAIPDQLRASAAAAGATVETGTMVEGLDAGDDEVTLDLGGETSTLDAAVVATDPPTARELTGVEAIPTEGRGCVTQYYALPAEENLDVGGRIVLNADDDRPNIVVPNSEVAPGHAPVGRALVSASFLGTPEDSASELAAETRAALSSWFPERRFDDLAVLHTARVPFAQFASPPGFRASLPSADAPDGPVVLAGDYTRWSSIQGALEIGRRAAWALAD
ncbi:MAG: FAD-dependent oxidoreductase [Halobacteriales archaeon]